jgi:sulfur carrier protein ThiS
MIKVGDQEIAWREGLTVAGMLELLEDDYDYPAVKLRHEVISKAKFGQTLVPDGAEIHLIPLIAGG